MHQGQPLALDETSHTKIKQKKYKWNTVGQYLWAALDDYLIRKSFFKAKIIFWLANAPALQRLQPKLERCPAKVFDIKWVKHVKCVQTFQVLKQIH